MALRAFLELPNGTAVRIGPAGLLLGRHRTCDIQLADQSASRRHALLRVSPEGVELVVLGRQPVHLNDRPSASVHAVRAGDRLRFPGLECHVRVEPYEESVPIEYCLRRGGDRFPIHASPFVVGTGATARLVIATWPDEALRFSLAQGVLHVEATEAGLHNGVALEPDNPVVVQVGDTLEYRGETLHIEQATGGDASTVITSDALASAVVLHPLPRGGRIAFTFSDGDRIVYLPGRRYQLLSALLAPPAPHVTGEFIPDHVVIPLVWDDEDVGGRQEINVLLTRCRQDLVAVGIAATSLIERAPGGRATRVRVAPDARITTASD